MTLKRVRCPKCDMYVTFNNNGHEAGRIFVLDCTYCGKQFKIRTGVPKTRSRNNLQDKETWENTTAGYLTVIENVFHHKQKIPLSLGVNVLGRRMRGSDINCPIETNDPSIDTNHCSITVNRSGNGKLRYILKDGPSNTGTFVDNDILGDSEQRIIEDGTLFTIGATSIILHTEE